MKDISLPAGTKLAICCTYRDIISGNGYLAKVEVCGRILAVVDEDGEVWIHGVQPSGLAEGGATLLEAHANFRQAYTAMLFDVATTATSYANFEGSVKGLMQPSSALDKSWEDAARNLDKEIAAELGLPITKANNHQPSVTVTEIKLPEEISPALNTLDEAPHIVFKKAA
jgi:hypothetical protein